MALLSRCQKVEAAFFARIKNWLPWVALCGLTLLLVFQAWAYYFRLPLSLGPRVILQPWLLRQGFIDYENIADLHTPLMPMIIAALSPLVPDGLRLAKLVLVALLTMTGVLTFIAGWLKSGWLAGLLAAGIFVVWSPAFGLQKLWYEAFLGPIYLIWLAAYRGSSVPRSIQSLLFLGFLGGIAVLIKQQAALVFAVFVLWQAFTGWTLHHSLASILREAGTQCLAAVVPVAIYVVYQYAQAGTLASFLYWTIGYQLTSNYKSLAALSPTPAQVRWLVSSGLVLPGAVFCCIDARRKGDSAWLHLGLALGLAVVSSLTVYPRFDFFHLAATLPILAVTSSITLAYLLRLKTSIHFVLLGVALALLFFWLATAGSAYRQVANTGTPRKIYEYSDLVPLAQQIRPSIPPGGSLYLFPDDESKSNLYYLLGKQPPRFWIFHYTWYFLDWTKIKILNSLTGQPPDWIIYFPGHQDIEALAPDILTYIQDHYQHAASFQWAQGEVWLLKRNLGPTR